MKFILTIILTLPSGDVRPVLEQYNTLKECNDAKIVAIKAVQDRPTAGFTIRSLECNQQIRPQREETQAQVSTN